MHTLLPHLKMPKPLVSMLDNLIKAKADGQYRISLNNTEYSAEHGGVRPYQIEVEKEKGGYRLLSLSNFAFFGHEFTEATHFDFIERKGFIERVISFNFDDDPYIDEALEANSTEMAQYYELGFFDLPVITPLKIQS